jgi:formiminoglutamase
MNEPQLPHDAKWKRANTLFTTSNEGAEIALLGVPAHKTSLSPTSAHLTPSKVRELLAKYSTFSTSAALDLDSKTFCDLGDIDSPDGEDGYERIKQKVSGVLGKHKLLLAIGGDNSITYSLASNLWMDLSNVGLITLDAHHDLRDGHSNGSPVWQLIQAGMPGKNIVQIGIADFANSLEYSTRAKENGLTVISRAALRNQSIAQAVAKAIDIAGAGGREIYVDLDVDVCDRSVVPACPASMPGGLTADQLREAAYLLASEKRVRAIDITEIDAAQDAPDQRTLRLAALLILEASAGFATR